MTTEVFKILIICFLAAAFCVVLRGKNEEYAILVSVATGVFVTVFLFQKIVVPISAIEAVIEKYAVETEYFKTALKAVGIGYVTSFISDICRDSGQVSLASKAELAGKCALFLLSVPLIIKVLETAIGFMK